MYPVLPKIGQKNFSINWLPVHKQVHQFINVITFKFANNSCPHYLNEVFEYAAQCRIESRSNFWQKGLSYIGPSLWNNLPGSMKKTTFLNAFKHNMKNKYLGNLAGT